MTKKHKQEKLWKRFDVVNRGLLRSVRRFYLEEFKKDNKRIIKKRFKQVKGMKIFEGFRSTCCRLFGNIPNLDSIAQFLMIICSVKHKGSFTYDESIKAKGDLVLQVMHKYSNKSFEKIFKIEELEYVVKYLVENHKERIFKFTRHMQALDYQTYSKVLDSWIFKFDELLTRYS